MATRSWIRQMFARTPRWAPHGPRKPRPRFRLSIDVLEDRLVPSTFTVMNNNNSGAGSLRQAILDANAQAGADVITFDPAAFSTPSTIRLLSSLPDITDDLTINGPAAARLTISGDANNDGANDDGDVRILSVSAGDVTLSDLTLTNGRARGADGSGGLHAGNGGDGLGGAIDVAAGSLTLNNSTVSNNTAQGGRGGNGDTTGGYGGNGRGGAIYLNFGATATLINSTLSGNTAQGGASGAGLTPGGGGSGEGGGLFSDGTLTMTNVTVSGNSTSNIGGGLFSDGTLTMTNVTVSGNSAGGAGGGGLQNGNHGTLTLTNVTVSGNTSQSTGGLVNGEELRASGTVTLTNSIVAGNTGGRFSPPNIFGAYSASHSLVDVDPMLAPMGDYGGPTQTMPPLPGSPALDAGDSTASGLPSTDQRGFARISGAAVDIGACEAQLPTLSPNSLPNGVPGIAYSQTITATEETGGAGGPYTFAVSAGALPVGLSLASDGTLSGTPTTLGSSTFTVTATDSAGFTASLSYTLTIDRVVPTLAVNPVYLVYGTALADSQLVGTATAVINGQTVNVPGTFFFGISGQRTAGTVLGAGDHYQWFTFVPDDPAAYYYVGTSVPVHVARATPTLSWSPAAITYGTPLSDAQLDAQAAWTVGGSPVTVAGTFTYTPAAGTVLNAGSQTLSVHFVPADAADYDTPADMTVLLTVKPAVLTVTANNASRVYGAANPAFTYSITGFVNNDPASVVSGTAPLSTTATATSRPGNYAITPDVSQLSAANYTFSPVNGTLTVTPAPLSATGVNVSATAGAPFSGTVANFTTADKIDGAGAFTAVITWGDGSTSSGAISGSSGSFSVSGSHTYAAAGNLFVSVQITHTLGCTTSATTSATATVSSLGQGVVKGLTGTIGFWQSTGQALIKGFNGGGTATALGNWLAASFPNLYGASAGANNLAGKTNAKVAAFYLSQFALSGPKVEAQVLATALSVYATTASLGGTAAAAYGFTVSSVGLGAYGYNVGSDGAAFGVANNSTLDVYQLLRAVNGQAVNGVLYNGDAALRQKAADLFDALNQAGSIG
jgi:hypothetical protein